MADPRSTYRLQLHPGFGFDDAAAVAAYLAGLGVSHVYCSPYLQAAPGSTHGYDVVDHSRVNEELGGEAGHARLCAALGAAGLGQVLDIVPNHMAIGGRENVWWWDVLENGQSSRWASYFDVDWDPPETKLRNVVLLPVLGDHYGRVLEAGELRLEREGGSFVVRYHEHVAPIAPRSLDDLLMPAAAACGSDELESIAAAFGRLPPSTATDLESVRERHRDKEVLRARLAELFQESPEVAKAVDEAVARTNADPDALDALLERQNFRLAYWRTAGRELDYRRFFDITTLVALRTEDPTVFGDTHGLVLGWLAEGVIDGVRVDHPDGLRDPAGYLERLAGEAPGAWVVIEKILEPGERLPPAWPVAGTTGYDFANLVTGLFVDPAGEKPLTDAYAAFTHQPTDFEEVALDKKHLVLREVLAADVNRLTNLFVHVCEDNRRYRDYTRHDLHEALREVIACFPVYRSYVTEQGRATQADLAYVGAAVARAVERRPDLDPELLEFLHRILVGHPDARTPVATELRMRFQQTTGPAMAKGVEDTAFYTYNRLVALNEVGGDPGRFGVAPEEFHAWCADAQRHRPAGMLGTSTHDTKRSEDVRARLALLSEMPAEWGEVVARWTTTNKRHRAGVDRPDRNAEWLLYQTLVGAHPLPVDRAAAYMEKASREAKTHTSWTDPDPEYDAALQDFVAGALGDDAFIADLDAFVAGLAEPARVNSLAQVLLKLTAPGVPDVYQGQELWDLSLVDPDNRRPVDYGERARRLAEVDAGLAPEEAWRRAGEGLPKLLLTTRALRLRHRLPEAFGPGSSYEPLAVDGPKAAHAVAFVRGGRVVTVVPRLVLGLGGDWEGTMVDLPDGRWRDELTGDETDGGRVPVGRLLARFPVALLLAVGA